MKTKRFILSNYCVEISGAEDVVAICAGAMESAGMTRLAADRPEANLRIELTWDQDFYDSEMAKLWKGVRKRVEYFQGSFGHSSADGSTLYFVDDSEAYVLRVNSPMNLSLGFRSDCGIFAIETKIVHLLREFYYEKMISDGKRCLHASVLSNNGAGVVFIGNKGAGKTTICTSLMALEGYDFIANDRSMIDLELNISPFPSFVRIGPGTFDSSPHLKSVDLNKTRRVNRALSFDGKVELSPAEFTGAFSKTPVDQAKVALVLLPRLDTTVSGVHVESWDDKESIVEENVFDPVEDVFRRNIAPRYSAKLEGSERYLHRAIATEILKRKPKILRFGFNADPIDISKKIEGLLGR